jgi:hypothetical protein
MSSPNISDRLKEAQTLLGLDDFYMNDLLEELKSDLVSDLFRFVSKFNFNF